jgi:hypothetical protein
MDLGGVLSPILGGLFRTLVLKGEAVFLLGTYTGLSLARFTYVGRC